LARASWLSGSCAAANQRPLSVEGELGSPFLLPLSTRLRGTGLLRTSPVQNSPRFITLGMRSACSAMSSNRVEGMYLKLRLMWKVS
jgi:hypothetical protein